MADVSLSTTANAATSSTSTELDLAFIIDATPSMTDYIQSAEKNMRKIIEDIISSEQCLLKVGLILYRDHPPQDKIFFMEVTDFTDGEEIVKKHLETSHTCDYGDYPEAVAPALHAAVHNLSWRQNSTKIALLITDAPPHGLSSTIRDNWPNGDPSGHDPMECVALLAERGVTLYVLGCEPRALVIRHFFMALAFKTGGQYIPLENCENLASVIIGSAQEEISLERLIAQVHEEVMREAALRGGPVDEVELTRRIHEVMKNDGVKTRKLKIDNINGKIGIPEVTPEAEQLSKLKTMSEVKLKWVRYTEPLANTTGIESGSSVGSSTSVTTTLSAPITPGNTNTIMIANRPTKRRSSSPVKPLIKNKRQRIIGFNDSTRLVTSGRRSARLVFNMKGEKQSNGNETMDTSSNLVSSSVSDVKLTQIVTETTNRNVQENELDIGQTRRLVRKCVARNKLKST